MEISNFKIYKPFGYLSQFVNNQTKRKNKNLLGELFDFPTGTMAIGRLDEDSEGLLLLTTSGMISEVMRSRKVEKEYWVQVDGQIGDVEILQLKQGVEIKVHGKIFLTSPCEAFLHSKPPTFPERGRRIRDARHGPTSWISVTLTEGKFRQVRKMTAAVGYPTLRLVRVRIGDILLEDMNPGEVKGILLESFGPILK